MTKTALILSILLTLLPTTLYGKYTDPLLEFLYSLKDTEVEETRYTDYDGDYDSEPQHYSWDNLYLCKYCATEVITDPYEDIAEDGVYNVNYGYW